MTQRHTGVRLLSGVPFDNTYTHTRWFDSEAQQTSYFTSYSPVKQGVTYSYQREQAVFRVDASRESLLNVNYIMYQNTEYKNKWFYGFVTELEYKNDDVTFVHFQIDVMQTWMFNYTFKPSYIVREHTDRRLNGKIIPNTIDEQLMYGSEYDLAFTSNFHPSGVNYLVIITSEALGTGNTTVDAGGTIVGSPSSFSYYIVPVSLDGQVYDVNIGNTGEGGTSYLGTFKDYIAFLSEKEPFLNRIISMYMTSYCGINFIVNDTARTVSYVNNGNIDLGRVDYMAGNDGVNKRYSFFKINQIISFESKEITVTDDIYKDFISYYLAFETKSYMYPYCLIELADMKGNILTLKPEYLKENTLKLRVYGSLGASNKVSIVPVGYNTRVDGTEKFLADFALIDSDPTDIGIKNDYAAAFMQGQKNSLLAQQSNIYNSEAHGMVSASMSGIGAVTSGFAAGGNPFVALTNLMGAGQQTNNIILEKENALATLSGKVQDIRNVPATVSQMGANTSFSFGNFHNNVYVRFKIIKTEYMERLDTYFKTYGTKKLDIKHPNLHTRRYWNFIKTKECNIVGTINNTDLAIIKQIFDAGITLWHDNNVLDYNRDNTEV